MNETMNRTTVRTLRHTDLNAVRTGRPLYASVWLGLLQQLRRRQRLRAWLLRNAHMAEQNK